MINNAPGAMAYQRAPWRLSKPRVGIVAAALIYIGLFHLVLLGDITKHYAYYGFTDSQPSTGVLVISWAYAAAPSLWLPIRFGRVSHVLYWVLYLVVLVPSMTVPVYAQLNSPTHTLQLTTTLFVCFAFLNLSFRLRVPARGRSATSTRRFFWPFVTLLSAACYLYMFATLGSHFQFVSVSNVYGLRALASSAIHSSLAGYALLWQAFAINPFLMAYGIYVRRRILVAIAVIGQVLIYGLTGDKVVLFSIILVVLVGITTRGGRLKLGSVIATMAGLSLLVGQFAESSYSVFGASLSQFINAMVMRTFFLPGLLTSQYYKFFSTHPQTLFTHTKPVALFIHPRYPDAPATEIAKFFYGTAFSDNAHVWAGDGIAGLGLWGIPIVTVLLALTFLLVDASCAGVSLRFGVLAFVSHGLSLSNGPLTSAIFGGGLWLSIALCYLVPLASQDFLPRHAMKMRLGKTQTAALRPAPPAASP